MADALQAAYDAAVARKDRAVKQYHEAERILWDAEREWNEAEREVQQAFVNIANAHSNERDVTRRDGQSGIDACCQTTNQKNRITAARADCTNSPLSADGGWRIS